jgi:predicted dehydrogenase
VHILTQILGPVKRVSAFSALALPEIAMTAERVRGQTLRVETDDTILMLLDFGNAVLASVDASYNVLSSRLPVMHVGGSAGALTAPQFMGDEVGSWRCENGQWHIANLPATEVDRLGIAVGLPHWLDCIRNGTRPVNDGRHARHVLDVLLSVQRSASTGRAVALQTTF